MTTATVFVIKNQTEQFLSKQQEWVDAGQSQHLFRTAHRDEAINTVFEVSSKDIYLRAEIVACHVDGKGQPLLGEPIDAVVPALIEDEADEPISPEIGPETGAKTGAKTEGE